MNKCIVQNCNNQQGDFIEDYCSYHFEKFVDEAVRKAGVVKNESWWKYIINKITGV